VTFLRNGGNLFSLQAALGHEQLETCRIYLSMVEADLEVAQRSASPADNWKL
jgi:integrase/recombinase XerD